MDLEILRLLADHAKDDTLGVKAKLDGLTLDEETDEKPETVFIADETRDRCALLLEEPPEIPALYFRLEGLYGLKGDTLASSLVRDTEGAGIPIGIRWIDQQGDQLKARQARSYGIRALLQSLEELAVLQGQTSERNGIEVISMQSITVGPWNEKIGNYVSTAAVLVTFQVRENTPI